MKLFRLILNLCLFLGIFFGPFWVPLFFLVFGLFAIPYYVESIIAFFSYELLYRGAIPGTEAFIFSTPVIAFLLFFAVQGVRKVAHEYIFRF